ncbi:MAG: hypothetical protein KO206_07140 [Methanomicrobiaceae archaeon]|nr:hypothetical protein [Methanomicrobiaceae archaeon]MDD5418791.1 hypothetical protein [Methanomicrobiaceae archaeon]
MARFADTAAAVLSYAKTLPQSTYISFLGFLLGVAGVLVSFQYAILRIIPAEFTLRYIYLNVNAPTLSAMFLNNYMHNPMDASHIASNLPATVFLIAAVFTAGTILLPAFGCRMPQGFFPATYLVFFLLLPFPISGISIWSARIMGKVWSSGFSGINYALLGLLFFLMLSRLYIGTLRDTGRDACRSAFALLLGTFLLLALAILFIFIDLHATHINVYAHLGGFLLGLIVPALVGLLLSAEDARQKALAAAMIGLVVLAPAVGWLAMPY